MTLDELNDVYSLHEQRRNALELLENLRAQADVRAQAITGLPRANISYDRVGALAASIVDAESVVSELDAQIGAAAVTVNEFVQSVNDLQARTAFRLRYLDGLTWAEAAAAFGPGWSEAALKSRCYRYLHAHSKR